jgi:hypothetical protein
VGSSALYVVAPDGHPWPIDMDAAEASLRQHWPTAHVTRQVSAVSGAHYLSFDVVVNGAARWGTLEPGRYLSLAEGSPADWADTIVWFIGQLPARSTALAAVEENPELAPLARDTSVQEVRELYERLDRY